MAAVRHKQCKLHCRWSN